MKRLGKKIGILFIIFIAAIAIYFVWNQKRTEKPDSIVYTAMDEAALPVVSATMFGRDVNFLHGYTQDMKQAVARDSLTVLPSDRALNIRIADFGGSIRGISYEVRSLNLERLVERTSLTEWDTADGKTTAVLPIQNLLSKDREYLLILSLDTAEQGEVRYYTRILWTDNENVKDMIDFAVNFTTKTFDYDQARELTTYLETNATEDNSSLGHVTIRSSFSQLTWAGLDVKPVGDIRVTLKDLDGIMCTVRLDYQLTRTAENGINELYEVEDDFTMKWDSKRIYLMDFERNTNQIFSGQRDLFSGKRIMLGIMNDSEVRTEASPDGRHIAYVVNRDLWSYDQSSEKAVKIFSFRSGDEDEIRNGYDQHDIRILSIGDNGDVNFIVYGYMNRGIHEGAMGIAMYQYSSDENAIKEKFFTPVTQSFEMLKDDIDKLAHLGSNGMLYMMADHAVYGIDLNSNEYMVLADSLTDGSFAVSRSERRFAWQEGSDPYGSRVIHLMDLDTGSKKEITGEDGSLCRPLGFVGDDFIYGLAREGDMWIENGRVKDAPMYRLEIMDDTGAIVNQYEYPDTYIADVEVEENRIRLTKIAGTGDQSYTKLKDDIIVCNEELKEDPLKGIGWYASEDRRKLYFVQLDKEAASHNVKVSVPKKMAYESAEVVELKSNAGPSESLFYAYGAGHYLGSSRSFTEALNLAYDKMGVVTDKNQEIVWNRVNRSPARSIKDPENKGALLIRHMDEFSGSMHYDDGILMLDARGCILNQVLYFISKGCPVAVYTENGGYELISGYDQYNVTIYNPTTKEARKMGLNDASQYFSNVGNDFVCGVFTE